MLEKTRRNTMQNIRAGLRDLWNSFMVTGANFSPITDMPITSCVSNTIPVKLLSYTDAQTIYNKEIKTNPCFKENAFIHFYLDDYSLITSTTSIAIVRTTIRIS